MINTASSTQTHRPRRVVLVEAAGSALAGWVPGTGWSIQRISPDGPIPDGIDILLVDERVEAPPASSVPVVVFGEQSRDHGLPAAHRRGACDYVSSRAAAETWMMVLERAIAENQLQRENAKLLQRLQAQDALGHANQDNLSLAYRQVEQASRAKSAFLTHMSHELRTPLNAIIGYVELVQEQLGDDEESLEDLGRALSAANHLHSLVGEVLDLAAVEAGKIPLQPRLVHVHRALTEVATLLHHKAEIQHNQIQVDAPEDLTFDVDPTRLRQVLLHVVSNACKFTHDGTITLRAKPDGECMSIEVQDTGIGMSDDELERAFLPFEQANDNTKYQHGGVGLGLAISRELCVAMQGELLATSATGHGSCFKVLLPLHSYSAAGPG